MFEDFTDFVLQTAVKDQAQMARLFAANPDIRRACEAVMDAAPKKLDKPAPGDLSKIGAIQATVFDNYRGQETGRGQRYKVQVKIWGDRINWKRPVFQAVAAQWPVGDSKNQKTTLKLINNLVKTGAISGDTPQHILSMISNLEPEYVGIMKSSEPRHGSHYHNFHYVLLNLTKRQCIFMVQAPDGVWGLEFGKSMWDYNDSRGKPLSLPGMYSIRHSASSEMHGWMTGTGKPLFE